MSINLKYRVLFFLLVLSSYSVTKAQEGTYSYMGFSVGMGYASLLDQNFDNNGLFHLSSLGGPGATLGWVYELSVEEFRFSTGIEASLLNSTSQLSNFIMERTMSYPYPDITYRYEFMKFREIRTVGYISIPLLFGGLFENKFYFLAGAKVGMSYGGWYKILGDIDIYANDAMAIDPYLEMPNHHLYQDKYSSKGKAHFNLNISGAVEFGIDLNERLSSSPTTILDKQKFKYQLNYRIGLFAEYGLLNINNYKSNWSNSQHIDLTNSASSRGDIPVFSGSEPYVYDLNSTLSNIGYSQGSLHRFMVRIKFTILYVFIPRVKRISSDFNCFKPPKKK